MAVVFGQGWKEVRVCVLSQPESRTAFFATLYLTAVS